MRGSLVLALAAGATLAIAMPSDAAAQSRSIRETWEQVARRNEREDDRDNARERERERERARAEQRERDRERVREQERERMRAQERERQRERERAQAVREQWERERRINEEQRRRAEERQRRDRDWDDDDDDYRSGNRNGNGNGPAFCRSGEGHPVYGREWCRQRGYDLGRGRGWERERWNDIVFRDSRIRRNERLSRSALTSMLGSSVLRRFEQQGRRYGAGQVIGYWLPEAGNVLQLSVGGTPFARLIDTNRDRRVDYVLVRR